MHVCNQAVSFCCFNDMRGSGQILWQMTGGTAPLFVLFGDDMITRCNFESVILRFSSVSHVTLTEECGGNFGIYKIFHMGGVRCIGM